MESKTTLRDLVMQVDAIRASYVAGKVEQAAAEAQIAEALSQTVTYSEGTDERAIYGTLAKAPSNVRSVVSRAGTDQFSTYNPWQHRAVLKRDDGRKQTGLGKAVLFDLCLGSGVTKSEAALAFTLLGLAPSGAESAMSHWRTGNGSRETKAIGSGPYALYLFPKVGKGGGEEHRPKVKNLTARQAHLCTVHALYGRTEQGDKVLATEKTDLAAFGCTTLTFAAKAEKTKARKGKTRAVSDAARIAAEAKAKAEQARQAKALENAVKRIDLKSVWHDDVPATLARMANVPLEVASAYVTEHKVQGFKPARPRKGKGKANANAASVK